MSVIQRVDRQGLLLTASLLLAAACSSPSGDKTTAGAGGSASTATGGGSDGAGASGGSAGVAVTTTIAAAITAADTFLQSLGEADRTKVHYEFSNATAKAVWSNYPIQDVPRNGLVLRDLTDAQRANALALLRSLLSEQGYDKAVNITNADEALSEMGVPYEAGNTIYAVAIFGTPSATDPWMLQFSGHHLSLNITVTSDDIILTPTLTGCAPCTYDQSGTTVRPLGDETDKGFALLNALTAAHKQQAVLGTRAIDLVLGPGQDGRTIVPEGSAVSGWSADEQAKLFDVASEWVDLAPDNVAAIKMAEIRANLGDTYFAWYGSTTAGGVAYYRIQGPTVVIEYSNQMMDSNHIHAMYRDPTNDYGVSSVQ